jgi:hypothetical protein
MNSLQPLDEQNPEKPVAYDQYGRPLYAHPPQAQPPAASQVPVDAGGQPQVVYMTRAIDPHQQQISPEVQAKHEESLKKYPHLNLSDGEFVISAVRRHPIGILSIWGVVAIVLIIILILPTLLLSLGVAHLQLSPELLVSGGVVLLMVAALAFLAGVVGTIVYDANRFYLTNESVTQHIQTSLFNKKDQTISLGNVEDASYRQRGIIQTILNYGSIRLSTQGEETTYRFNFVADPKEQIRLLNDAVEAFKNYRPIHADDDDQ